MSHSAPPPASPPSGHMQPGRYTRVAVALHWTIALLILANVALGLGAGYVPDADVRGVIDLHKSIGITVLGLAILRLLWRATHRPPALPAGFAPLERAAAHTAHALLYVLIFALPITGWIHDSAWSGAATHKMMLFWTIPWFRLGFVTGLAPDTRDMVHHLFGQVHTWLGYALYAVLAAHVLGALKHQFVERVPELRRMWF